MRLDTYLETLERTDKEAAKRPEYTSRGFWARVEAYEMRLALLDAFAIIFYDEMAEETGKDLDKMRDKMRSMLDDLDTKSWNFQK